MVRKIRIISLIITFFLFNMQFAKAKEIEKIGEEEVDYHKMFLRQSSVLLKKGDFRLDFDFIYDRSQQQLFLNNYNISRQLNCEATFTYGFTKGVEIFIAAPIIWKENTLRMDPDNKIDHFVGIGDLNVGVKYLLQTESEWPEIITTLSTTIPIGQNVYENNIGIGLGYYTVTSALTFIKSSDPAVLFSSLSLNYPFGSKYGDYDIRPGCSIGYNFGLGLAFNDRLTLSETFTGSYQSSGKSNHPRASNVTSEPMLLRSDITYIVNSDFTVTPSLSFGLNDDASDVSIGCSFSRIF